MIKENTLYKMALPSGILPPQAFTTIKKLLPKNRQEFLDELLRLDKIHWQEWYVQRGPVAGIWPKRFNRAWYKRYHTNIPPKELASIGEHLGKAAKGTMSPYFFDFEKQANWVPGDFGEDRYSCWWDDYNNARTGLIRRGGGAILFYRDEAEFKQSHGTKGIARAWMFPRPHDKAFFIFNAYGLELQVIAHVVSTALGLSYKSVGIEIPDGYANSDKGYAIGAEGDLNELSDDVSLEFADEIDEDEEDDDYE